MNYTPQYNALGLKDYLEKNPNSKIDYTDAILLNELYMLINNWQNINKKVFNNKTYYNIAYSKLRQQLPGLNFGTKKNGKKVKKPNDGISERLKNGLRKENLIDFECDKNDSSKTYFRLTNAGYEFVTYRKHIGEGVRNKSERVSEINPNNKNIKNKNIKNKRELSHFDFLNSLNEIEMNSIKENYKLPVNEWKLCIDTFNEKKINEPTIHRFKKFVNNWSNNLPKERLVDNRTALSKLPIK